MNRRSCLAALLSAAGVSAAEGGAKPIELHVDLAVDPAKEREMLSYFHTVFRPAAAKQAGFIDGRMIKLDSAVQGTAPKGMNYRFVLIFKSEALRQKWVASATHKRVWPEIEKTLRNQNYTVLLFDHT